MQLKNYLGLGIMFQGIDDGLGSTLDNTVSGFNDATESLGKLTKASSSGAFSNMVEGFQLMSIGQIGSQLEEMSQGISGTDKTFNQLSVTLDTLRAKFSQAVNPELGAKLNSMMMSSMRNTGVTADQAEVLANGMTNFGRGLDDAVGSLPFMSKLVGIVGLEAGQVSEMFGQGLSAMKATPNQMKKLVKETIKLGKSYNLTGQVEILPELFASVTKNAARFGQVNADAAIRSTMGLSRMVAAFRKVGKSQQEAVGASVGFNDKMADIGISMRRFDVGLGGVSDEVLKLEQAMTEAGIADPFGTIRAGIKNPSALLDTLGDQIEGLSGTQKTRVTELLRDVFGDDVTNLLSTYRDEAQGAIAEAEVQANKLGSADVEFDKLTGAMKNTLGVQQQIHETSKDLLQVQIDFATKTEILNHLAKERIAFAELGEEISDTTSFLGKTVKMLDLFKKGGLDAVLGSLLGGLREQGGLFGGLAAGLEKNLVKLSVFMGMLSSLLFPLASLVGLFHIFGGNLSFITGAFSSLGSAILWLVKAPFVLLGKAVMFTLGAVGALASGIKVGVAIKALFSLSAAMLASPIGVLIAGFALLGVAVAAAIIYWDDLKNYLSGFFSSVPRMASEAWNALTGFLDFDGLREKFATALNFVEILQEIFSADGAKGIFDFLLEEASSIASKIASRIKAAVTKFTSFNPLSAFSDEEKDQKSIEPSKSKGFFGSIGSMFSGTGEKDKIAPDNVIKFPENGNIGTGSKEMVSGFKQPETQGEQSNVIPMFEQPGAPSRARMPLDVKFEEKRTVGDENFQAVIDELRGMRTSLVEALAALSEQELKVELQGDIKKLLRQVDKNGRTTASNRGLNYAVNR